jgi:hypothetical protein
MNDRPPLSPIWLFFTALLFLCILSPVNAQNVTVSTLDQLGAQDILIYTFTDNTTPVLYGQWNTTSVDVPLPSSDFLIVMRPSSDLRYMDPGLILGDFMGFAVANVIPIVLIVFFIGLLWRRK